MRHNDVGTGGKGALAGWGIDVRDPTYLKDGISRSLAKRAFCGPAAAGGAQ
jgi:hypothetical protein